MSDTSTTETGELFVPIWHRPLLNIAEVAALTGVSLSTAHRWTREGLRTVPFMTEKRVHRPTLDAFLARESVAEAAA